MDITKAISDKGSDPACDQWCQAGHPAPDVCPRQSDPHRQEADPGGVRRPGDGLTEEDAKRDPEQTADSSNIQTSVSCPGEAVCLTAAALAWARVHEMGTNYISKDGDTLLHECCQATASMVHVCAQAGLPINAQNFAGDTALHLAVRSARWDVSRALLMQGADISVRNKLGQTALDLAQGNLKSLLGRYKPGLPQATLRGDRAAILRLIKLWCNPHSNIKGGKSALTLSRESCNKHKDHQTVFNLLTAHVKTLELVHSVLSEDIEKLKALLRIPSGCNINTRYRDLQGETPLACAIHQGNLEVTQLLANSEKCSLDIRVRESEEDGSASTIPVYFRSLDPACPEQIWKFLCQKTQGRQDLQKDEMGNTSLLRAIRVGRDPSFITSLMAEHSGRNITDRNMHGQTPRHLATALERPDVVAAIDKYLALSSPRALLYLPISFYGKDHLRHAKNGRGPPDNAVAPAADAKTLKNYDRVETMGLQLFHAAANGDVEAVERLNGADYRDKNGFTALTRAVVFNQLPVVRLLLTSRPQLKNIGDNCNRYPLHYAYSLPDSQAAAMVDLLMENNSAGIETQMDKDGRLAAEYKALRYTPEILTALHNARTLDPYGKPAEPMGPMPEDATTLREG